MKTELISKEITHRGKLNRITYHCGVGTIVIEEYTKKQNGFWGEQWVWKTVFISHGSQIKQDIDFYKSIFDFYEEESSKDYDYQELLKSTEEFKKNNPNVLVL